jgi:hypothetical protein
MAFSVPLLTQTVGQMLESVERVPSVGKPRSIPSRDVVCLGVVICFRTT